ncbi:MAG TPA: cytochrome c biogenesis protein CcsA [Flavisolibacter sp.]|nr:cytochrome c biogenesis protein CcsA [Flavisolibacter sp.]
MNFTGEHLMPGKAGHFFILLSLVCSLAASLSYFLSVQKKDPAQKHQWKVLGRLFFYTGIVSIFSIFITLFYIISHHFFEYKYAWQHSSLQLETKYLLSCFWEGQEGSFLLWSIWQSVLGFVFIRKEKNWEAPVLSIISFSQFCITTLITGITIAGLKIGSNPFILLRNSGVLDNAPAFHDLQGFVKQDYLSLLKDGNDLNPLLQNYWMVIHPPVLFLGFASTIIPFAFAISGLWTKKLTEWTKAALPWALFSAGVLGLGIMMGAAWAYESLNFGGYWAWDPVENAVLVPWLVMVAGIHTLLIYRHTGNALRSTYLFLVLSFLLILYSTYLTRSGDLQDTSVHAFTDLGMNLQLRLYLFIFLIPSLILLIKRYKTIPSIPKEEETSSREFWMFIGSIVLFLSSLMIIAMTSIPVINKLGAFFTGKEKLINPLAIGEDSRYAYNRVLIFVVIIIGLFAGFGMYLKYKKTSTSFFKKILSPSIAALIIATLILAFGDISYKEKSVGFMAAIWVAVATSVFSLVTNASYIWIGLKGGLGKSGGAIAHVGFAMMLAGILISSSKKEVLSYNTSGIPAYFGENSKEKPGENLTLVKGMKTEMGPYWVTYDKDSANPDKPLWYYHLSFENKDGKERFSLSPNAFVNYKGNAGLMANPDSKHYFTHDVFTYITSLADPQKAKDTTSFTSHQISIGDTLFYSKGFIILEDLQSVKSIPGVDFKETDSATVANMKVMAKTSSMYTIRPILINKGGVAFSQPDTLMPESLVIQLQKVNGKKAEVGIKETDSILQYVTLKAYKFPFIILLWLGTIIMVIGFLISMLRRVATN